jgi:hypothetical protein
MALILPNRTFPGRRAFHKLRATIPDLQQQYPDFGSEYPLCECERGNRTIAEYKHNR